MYGKYGKLLGDCEKHYGCYQSVDWGVYNYIHIGNARSTVAFDTIRRYFEYRGYTVNYISNFTDVDDKIIKAANEAGISTKELSDKFITAFMEELC